MTECDAPDSQSDRKDDRMPRQARVKDNYGIYHIYQRSHEERPLFRGEEDRESFWQVLTEASDRFPLRLLGYCLLDDNSYHLLMKLDGCDISKLMKSINISYVRRIEAPAGLFRDRFQSELIETVDGIEALHLKLQDRAKGEERWNSFCHFDQQALADVGLRTSSIHEVLVSDADEHRCEEAICLEDPDALRAYLEEELLAIDSNFEEMLRNRTLRNDYIARARRRSTLSLREIGQLFGGLSESSISKIVK